jgi:hypothetical protein
MCGSIFLGIFFGALAVKAMRRMAYHRHGGCGARGGGGGCGPCGGHAGKRFLYYRWGGGHPGGHARAEGAWGIHGAGAKVAAKPIAEVLRSLELNERQRQEAAPVLALAQEWIGPAGPRIEAALLAVAAERFEPVLVEALLEGAPENIRREVVEGLEHLHTILIAEQREQLRTQLSRGKSDPTPSGPAGGAATS